MGVHGLSMTETSAADEEELRGKEFDVEELGSHGIDHGLRAAQDRRAGTLSPQERVGIAIAAML